MDKCVVLNMRMPILRGVPAVSTMPRTFDFCLPTKATTVPHTPDWLHVVKYDGYRLWLERDGDAPDHQGRLQLD
jgi:ATP-dependent DNA ligase